MTIFNKKLFLGDSTSSFILYEFYRRKSNILLIFIVALFSMHCGHDQDHIDFFTGQKFRVYSGERIIENKSDVIVQYNSIFNSYKDTQIPLFKSIKHNDYEVFIGIPVSITISDLFQKISEEPLNKNLIYEKRNNNSYLLKYEKDSHRIVTFLSTLDDNSIISYSVMADDSVLINEYYSKNIFQNRLYD